ncbi:MAG: ABC transporter ATP-binding protein, partial [Thermoactinomyces sp.]
MIFDIEVNNVSLKYKDTTALNNISFRLKGGQIYGLLGRNGAGKTSLLSLLASFRQPTAGSVRIGGETPFENAKIMQRVCFIYEANYKEEWNKVQAMLSFAERYRPNFDMDYARQLVDRFKLPLNKPVNKLSKGMQSALNIVIGLASRSPVTIFDEAYLGMDAPTRETFYKELLEEQSRQPRTMILSTHLVSEMDYLFDEVLIINKGTLVLHKNYEELVSSGYSITGESNSVDSFVKGMQILNEQQLGNAKSVMVYGDLSEEMQLEGQQNGLEIGPVSLQDLF